MTPAETARVAEIAKGLTKAQRAAVLTGLGQRGLRDMRDAGVLKKDGARWMLTPLGLAVRAHLLATAQERGE